MKKFMFLLMGLMLMAILAACSGETTTTDTDSNEDENNTSEAAEEPAEAVVDDGQVYLVEGIRGLSNEYYTNWIKGGKNFAESVGIDEDHFIVMENQGSSEKQLSDIKAIVARTNGNVVFNLDPNDSADIPAIAEYLSEHKVPFVTWWNKPEDQHPWSYDDSWAMHITFDNYTSGYKTAIELMENMETPFEGKIVAIQGILGNTSNIERFKGFEAALKEHPKVELVSSQSANWSDTEAFSLMSNELIKTPDLDGVWSANDSMALGAIQALKSSGLAGKIPVTGVDGTSQMFDAIKSGDALATVLSDSYFQGGMGLAIGLAVKNGELNLEELPNDKRSWMAEAEMVTKDNVDEFIDQFYVNEPSYDWTDYFNKYLGPIE